MRTPSPERVPLAEFASGDPLADRRYAVARDLAHRGDLDAAQDLLRQTLDLAPGFAAAWFALGEVCEKRCERAAALAAFRRAVEIDSTDRLGSRLHLARLGDDPGAEPMSRDYVRTLFDQYAPHYDAALVGDLDYRAPTLLREAVAEATLASDRPARFRYAIDLGCGTGLAGEMFAACCETLVGIDLSAAMIEQARRRKLYADLVVGDIADYLAGREPGGADLIIAADVLAYVSDLDGVFGGVARVLAPRGLFAFTAETHGGHGVVLGDKLRYAHAASYVREVLARVDLRPLVLKEASARTETGVAVPGLVVVARR